MIIIGYSGIGKTKLAKNNPRCVDLDINDFLTTDNNIENWYKLYIKIAESLSSQGKIVLVDSRKLIRRELKFSKEKVLEIFPALSLRDSWVKRLKNRYNKNKTEESFSAYNRSLEMFETDISDMISDSFDKIILPNNKYDLLSLVNKYMMKNCKNSLK